MPVQLLDPNVLQRIAPDDASDALQGTNVKLLERLLDPAVFQRLSEATLLTPSANPYLGVDLLRDLNAGLFDELAWAPVKVGFYRRELQRNYVQLLVSGRRGKPEAQPAPERQLDVRPFEPWTERRARRPGAVFAGGRGGAGPALGPRIARASSVRRRASLPMSCGGSSARPLSAPRTVRPPRT